MLSAEQRNPMRAVGKAVSPLETQTATQLSGRMLFSMHEDLGVIPGTTNKQTNKKLLMGLTPWDTLDSSVLWVHY